MMGIPDTPISPLAFTASNLPAKGQRVQIDTPGESDHGKIGTVEDVGGTFHIMVKMPSGYVWKYIARELIPAEETE